MIKSFLCGIEGARELKIMSEAADGIEDEKEPIKSLKTERAKIKAERDQLKLYKLNNVNRIKICSERVRGQIRQSEEAMIQRTPDNRVEQVARFVRMYNRTHRSPRLVGENI